MRHKIAAFLRSLAERIAPEQRYWEKVPPIYKVGARVIVNNRSGFSKGLAGEIKFIEPSGEVWVVRDGASDVVFFYHWELDVESEVERDTARRATFS